VKSRVEVWKRTYREDQGLAPESDNRRPKNLETADSNERMPEHARETKGFCVGGRGALLDPSLVKGRGGPSTVEDVTRASEEGERVKRSD